VIVRSAKLIFITDSTILLSTMISSLVGARALGPAGRGDLLVVVFVAAGDRDDRRTRPADSVQVLDGEGTRARLTTVFQRRYLQHNRRRISILVADLIVPHLVGSRSPQVMTLLRIYQINIPAALFLNLMRGLLEGTRRFGWAGAARLLFLHRSGSRVCDSVGVGKT